MVDHQYDSEEGFNAYGIKPPTLDIFRHKSARGQAAPLGHPPKRREPDLRNTLNAQPAARPANGTIKFTGDTTAAARQQCSMAQNKRPCKWADPCPYNHLTHPAVQRT